MRTSLTPLLVVAGLASVLPSSRALAEDVRTGKVSYPSGDQQAFGFLALPPGQGKHPALVVIHEWWGLNDWVRGKAQSFAKQGYVALAVDLYRGKVAEDPDTAHQLMRGLPDDRARRDLDAAFRYLAGREDVDPSRIGAIGWCMGGGLVLDLAEEEPKLSAAVVYYGRLPTDPATIARIKAPVLGNWGALDKGIPPEDVKAFTAAADKAGVKVDAKIYPDAGHGFASNPKPHAGHGMGYVAGAAKDADARTDAFLKRTLKKG